MLKTISFIIIVFFSVNTFAQTNPEKIKVILLGTFHFGETSDRNSTNFGDLFTPKRQTELDTISNALNRFGINKFFVEMPTNLQVRLDSLYNLYLSNKLIEEKIKRTELIQVAFRTGAKNKIPMLAADFKEELPYDKINEYETKHKNDSNPYPFFDIAYPFKVKRKALKDCSLTEYYIQLNSEYSRQIIMYDYLHYAFSYGIGNDYTGANLTSVWYDRNLKIFNNILRQIDIKKDKMVVVLFGAAHTAVLRQFFENHPMFEIVELTTVLK